ncbi:MAG TPA: HAD family acid phosphatase [Xanthomonadales bacterium]|nr:HAD family acid phosphatase [Xanthomonadales bacterium]
MRPARTLILSSLIVLLTACAGTREMAAPPAPTPAPQVAPKAVDNYELDGLGAVVWSRTSAEAEAVYLQAYQGAKRALDMALADRSWTAATEQSGNFGALPPAIIVDIDETVLDTSDYMVERLRNGKPFSKADWNVYVQKANATPLPGALDFLKYASSKGVTIFYVSNRENFAAEQAPLLSEVEPTRANLAKYGFPNSGDLSTFLFRDSARGWKEKSPRRAEVARTHRIVMMAGDNLYDFIDIENADREKRDAAIESRISWLGTRWIVLPNPMYGSWEALVTGGLSGEQGRRARLESVGVPAASADAIAKGGFER